MISSRGRIDMDCDEKKMVRNERKGQDLKKKKKKKKKQKKVDRSGWKECRC